MHFWDISTLKTEHATGKFSDGHALRYLEKISRTQLKEPGRESDGSGGEGMPAAEVLPRLRVGVAGGLPGVEAVVPGHEQHPSTLGRTIRLAEERLRLGGVVVRRLERLPGLLGQRGDLLDVLVRDLEEAEHVETIAT